MEVQTSRGAESNLLSFCGSIFAADVLLQNFCYESGKLECPIERSMIERNEPKRGQLETLQFHQRRFEESRQYVKSLQHVVFSNLNIAEAEDKATFLSRQRTLIQPGSYEILSLIWTSSPCAYGEPDRKDWTIYQNIRSLEKGIAGFNSEKSQLRMAIGTVVKAASYFQLVARGSGKQNSKPIKALPLLDRFFVHMAKQSLHKLGGN